MCKLCKNDLEIQYNLSCCQIGICIAYLKKIEAQIIAKNKYYNCLRCEKVILQAKSLKGQLLKLDPYHVSKKHNQKMNRSIIKQNKNTKKQTKQTTNNLMLYSNTVNFEWKSIIKQEKLNIQSKIINQKISGMQYLNIFVQKMKINDGFQQQSTNVSFKKKSIKFYQQITSSKRKKIFETKRYLINLTEKFNKIMQENKVIKIIAMQNFQNYKPQEIICTQYNKLNQNMFTILQLNEKRFKAHGLFNDVDSQVSSILKNQFNCALITYGCSGLGKSHFIKNLLIKLIQDFQSHITMSVIQFYNYKVRDIFGQDIEKKLSQIKFETRQVSLKNIQDILLEISNKRKTQETLSNKHSSRSHAVISLRVNNKRHIVLFDLAGRESLNDSQPLTTGKIETEFINQSLSFLTNSIRKCQNSLKVYDQNNQFLKYTKNFLNQKTYKILITCFISCLKEKINSSIQTLQFMGFEEQ